MEDICFSLPLLSTSALQQGSHCSRVEERATPKFAVSPSLIFSNFLLLVETVHGRKRHHRHLSPSGSRHVNCVWLQQCGGESDTRECLLTSPGKYVWVRRRRGEKKKKNPSCSSMAKVRKPRSGHVPDVGMSCVTTCSSSLFEGYRITHHSSRSAVVTFSPKGPRQNWKTFKSSRDGPTFDMGGWGVFWLVLLRRNGGRSLSTLSEARPNTFAHFCKVTPNTLAHPSNTLAHPSTLPLVGAL